MRPSTSFAAWAIATFPMAGEAFPHAPTMGWLSSHPYLRWRSEKPWTHALMLRLLHSPLTVIASGAKQSPSAELGIVSSLPLLAMTTLQQPYTHAPNA